MLRSTVLLLAAADHVAAASSHFGAAPAPYVHLRGAGGSPWLTDSSGRRGGADTSGPALSSYGKEMEMLQRPSAVTSVGKQALRGSRGRPSATRGGRSKQQRASSSRGQQGAGASSRTGSAPSVTEIAAASAGTTSTPNEHAVWSSLDKIFSGMQMTDAQAAAMESSYEKWAKFEAKADLAAMAKDEQILKVQTDIEKQLLDLQGQQQHGSVTPDLDQVFVDAINKQIQLGAENATASSSDAIFNSQKQVETRIKYCKAYWNSVSPTVRYVWLSTNNVNEVCTNFGDLSGLQHGDTPMKCTPTGKKFGIPKEQTWDTQGNTLRNVLGWLPSQWLWVSVGFNVLVNINVVKGRSPEDHGVAFRNLMLVLPLAVSEKLIKPALVKTRLGPATIRPPGTAMCTETGHRKPGLVSGHSFAAVAVLMQTFWFNWLPAFRALKSSPSRAKKHLRKTLDVMVAIKVGLKLGWFSQRQIVSWFQAYYEKHQLRGGPPGVVNMPAEEVHRLTLGVQKSGVLVLPEVFFQSRRTVGTWDFEYEIREDGSIDPAPRPLPDEDVFTHAMEAFENEFLFADTQRDVTHGREVAFVRAIGSHRWTRDGKRAFVTAIRVYNIVDLIFLLMVPAARVIDEDHTIGQAVSGGAAGLLWLPTTWLVATGVSELVHRLFPTFAQDAAGWYRTCGERMDGCWTRVVEKITRAVVHEDGLQEELQAPDAGNGAEGAGRRVVPAEVAAGML
ncbi:unnamed protein product [Amoebophrya sp. A120]|nr:unnamed protein product [Amoebophrya sp. A120]|eukprot:GSA120T00020553001.1